MEPFLSLRQGDFSYGAKTVFRNLDFRVERGETVCLLGANGCGKTTLLRCLNGLEKLDRGQVLIQGSDQRNMKPAQRARRIGMVFQEHSSPFPYSVLEVVRIGRAPHLRWFSRPTQADTRMAEAALAAVGMESLRNKSYTQISGGERQLVLIARALAQEPEIILLDEPTSHLGLKNQARVLGIIRGLADQGLTVVFSSHLPNQALLLRGRVVLMTRSGFLASGPPEKVVTEENLNQVYGGGVRVVTLPGEEGLQPNRLCLPAIEPCPAPLSGPHPRNKQE